MRWLVLTFIAVLLGSASAATSAEKPFEIVEATVDDIHAAMKSGRLTARALVEAYVARIEALDKKGPGIN